MADKHTPGPWHTGHIGRKGLGWCTIFGSTTPIARALSLNKAGQRQASDFDTEAANARLMAGAPALLAACEAAHGLLSSAMVRTCLADYWDVRDVNDAIEAALAKAKG